MKDLIKNMTLSRTNKRHFLHPLFSFIDYLPIQFNHFGETNVRRQREKLVTNLSNLPQNSEPAIACEVARGEKGAARGAHAHCEGDVYLMNNYTRSALLEAVRGKRRWDLQPHLITGAVARHGNSPWAYFEFDVQANNFSK